MTQYTSHSRRRSTRALLIWFGDMRNADNRLSDDDRKSLERWKQDHLGDGMISTSDWPGWERYIGPRPSLPSFPHRPAYWPLHARKRAGR